MAKARGTIKQNLREDTLRFVLALAGLLFGIGFGVYLYKSGELMNGGAPRYFSTLLVYCLLVYRIMTGRLKRRYVGITDEKIRAGFGEVLGNYFAEGPRKKKVYKSIRLIINQEYEKAEKQLQKLEKKCSSNGERSAVWYLLGHCALEEEHYEKALQCMKQACSLRQGYVKALLAAARLSQKTGDATGAESYIMEAKEWAPEDPDVYEVLTWFYFSVRRFEEAMEAGKYWESLLPKSEDAASYRCAIAAFMGDFETAEEYYRRSEALGYDDMKSLRKIIDGKKR